MFSVRFYAKSTTTISGRYHVSDVVFTTYIPGWLLGLLSSFTAPPSLLDPNHFMSQIMAGLLLGDGCITKPINSGNCKLDLHAAWKDHNLFMVVSVLYALHCYDLGNGNFVQRKVVKEDGLQSYYLRIRAYSKQTAVFTEVRTLWYPNNIKRVPANIELYLTPIALAYWFVGDGASLQYTELSLNTQGFTLEEQELLCTALFNKYGLITRLGADKQYKRIVIKSGSTKAFADLVIPYLHSSALYKLRFVCNF